MSKFHKRVKKLSSNTEFCLVLRSGLESIEDFSEIFSCVFVYKDADPVYKAKNVVYQESFEELERMPHFDFVFTDEEGLKNLSFVQSLLRIQQPVLMVKAELYIDKIFSNILKECRYDLVDFVKGYQTWKKRT